MKFGVREICDVVLRAKSAMKVGDKVFYKNEPVLYFDSLKTSSMESQATTVYAQGGRGNARLIAWEGERTVTFTMEDALLSPEGFSILTGAGLVKAEEKSIIIHKTEITNKVRKKNGYVEIDLSEIPYIEAGKIQNYRYSLVVGNNVLYNSQTNYYNKQEEIYVEDDFLKERFKIYPPLYYTNNETSLKTRVQEGAKYDSNNTYWISPAGGGNFTEQNKNALIKGGFTSLKDKKEIYVKEEENDKEYQRANDNQDFIYVMLLDENGEVCSEPYIASEVELNSDKIYIYAQETDFAFVENPQESDVNITRKNDISKFTNDCSVLVDYYVKKDQGAFQINITPDKFGGNFYLEASTLFRDTNGTDLPAEFIIPNCKIQSNFTFTMASSGDPSTFTFTMDAFPDYTRWNKQQKVFASIQVIEQGDVLENLERLGTAHNYKSDEDYNPFLTFVREQEKYLLNSNEESEEFNNTIFSSIDENGDIYNNGLGYKKNYKFESSNSTSEIEEEGWTITGLIPYNKNQIIEINGFKLYNGAPVQGIYLFNNDKEFTNKFAIASNYENSMIYPGEENDTVSDNVAYIRVCFYNTKLSELEVVIKDNPNLSQQEEDEEENTNGNSNAPVDDEENGG